MLLFVRMCWPWLGKVRTEISIDKSLHSVVGISTEEHGKSTNIKHLSIAICVIAMKLLQGGRYIGETREEDVHDGHWRGWNWVVGQRITVVE